MAEQLEPTGKFQSERRAYPWNDWLNGRPWRLTMDYPERPGDFTPEPDTFRPYIYSVARDRGLKVAVAVEGDDVILQAYEPGSKRPTLPTVNARLANGQPDPAAPREARDLPTRGQEALRPEQVCRTCHTRLTPYSIAYGECRKVSNSAYRCTGS